MLTNHIKIAWRTLLRNKVYSFVNITGLTVGLAACLIVATVVVDDISYDKHWKKADHIYRIVSVNNSDKDTQDRSGRAFSGMAVTLSKTFPEVEGYCRAGTEKRMLGIGENKNPLEINALVTEPSAWKVFDFDVKQGNPSQFVKGYLNLVITERLRREHFPGIDPVGKIITNRSGENQAVDYLITGVIDRIPDNSHLRAEALVLQEYTGFADRELLKMEAGSFNQQYILLKPGASIDAFTKKMNKWYKGHIEGRSVYSYQFQPVNEVYLQSDFDPSQSVKGNLRNVYIFSVVASLLLLIACINFINLTTARALKRSREVGIRKILGPGIRALIGQFLFESILFFSISFVLGLILYYLFIQSVERYLDHSLTLTLTNNILLFCATCGLILLISVLTGLYPAWLLSGSKLADILRGNILTGKDNEILRKSLIVGQFTISIIILIATLVIHSQLRYFEKKDLGYDKDNLLVIDWNAWGTKGEVFKQEVLKLAAVTNVSIARWSPGASGGSNSVEIDDPKSKGDKLKAWYIQGDLDLAETLKLDLLDGRLLSGDRSTDALNFDSLIRNDLPHLLQAEKTQPMLMTAQTAKLLQINTLNTSVPDVKGVPVGIINDFNNESLMFGMKPCFIQAQKNMQYGNMLVRINPGTEAWVLEGINHLWTQFYPGKPLKYNWADHMVDNQYRAERKLQQLFTFFSLLIVFLACMGLFGLVSFTTGQRIKEIGIRKVLGASVAHVVSLISKDFLKLVFIAFIIASPIALYMMNLWLEDYSYRIHIGWWMFVLIGSLTALVAFATISFQAIKAALMNPVKSLRMDS